MGRLNRRYYDASSQGQNKSFEDALVNNSIHGSKGLCQIMHSFFSPLK